MMNILKSLAKSSQNFKSSSISPQITLINNYSKNVKTARKKAPHEAKNQSKWVSKSKGQQISEDTVDKQVAQREVVDSVWLMNEYKVQTFKIEDAINYHKELARPEMFNNQDGFLSARLILDMTSKKKGKFLDNFKSSVYFPHFFADGIKKEVVAICKNDAEIEAARNAGALFAGYTDILKKFEKGEISDQSYDFLVCTPETFSDVMLLKKKINKDKLPTVKGNTVTENIAEVVSQLHLSKDYEASKTSDEQAIIKTKIGLLNFDAEKLAENLGAFINKVKTHKKYATDTFITSCVLYSPPSTEKFKVDISRFVEVPKEEATAKSKSNADDDEELEQESVQ